MIKTRLLFEMCDIGYDSPLIRKLTLSVNQGDFISVVGPTGIGKSTLLRLIGDFDKHLAKPAVLSGVFKRGDIQKRSIVFQSLDQLLPWKTALGNLLVVKHSKDVNMTKEEIRFKSEALLKEVGLEAHMHKYPNHLSGGMRQRVAIARAMLKEPDLLLMDEPFGSLDGFTRQRLQALLLSLKQKHDMTVVFITHDVSEAAKLATKTLVIGSEGLSETLHKKDYDTLVQFELAIMKTIKAQSAKP